MFEISRVGSDRSQEVFTYHGSDRIVLTRPAPTREKRSNSSNPLKFSNVRHAILVLFAARYSPTPPSSDIFAAHLLTGKVEKSRLEELSFSVCANPTVAPLAFQNGAQVHRGGSQLPLEMVVQRLHKRNLSACCPGAEGEKRRDTAAAKSTAVKHA